MPYRIYSKICVVDNMQNIARRDKRNMFNCRDCTSGEISNETRIKINRIKETFLLAIDLN